VKIIKNPDNEFFKMARAMLLENKGYCPCALEKTDEFKCPCEEFRKSQEEGLCYCGLLFKTCK
jgi:ferredoxin-thioredoxin reductase catalytic subunit